MFRNLFLLLLLFVLPLGVLAQHSVSGTVYDFEDMKFPLQNVKVRNLTSGHLTLTKAAGQFNLDAKIGDLLEFSMIGYHTDTLFLINLFPKTIYLPGNSTALKEVKIIGAKINPAVLGSDPLVNPYRRIVTDGLRGKNNNDRAGGLIFGLGYGKYKREQEKVRLLEERDRYQIEINTIFTEEYVSDLVKLKGQDLKDFMAMYRPPEELVKSERPFNYAFYTVKAYHTWLKLPPEQRKQPQMPQLKAN